MKKEHGLGRHERITKNAEFKRMHKKGAFYRDGVFVLTAAPNRMGNHRLGVSIGKAKIPLASKRNRIKRLIKEAFRLNKTRLSGGPYDFVISLSKAPDFKIGYSEIENRFKKLLRKATIVCSKKP